jgi:diguanylate cyclase
MNRKASSHDQNDWKDKYLNALDQQEKRESQQQLTLALLIKAIVRISMVAEGVDQKLDKQLAGLRQLFRDGSPSGRDLSTVVDALEGQVKRLDTVKDERAKAIALAFQSLVSQLQQLKPEKEAGQQLKRLHKNLKARSGLIEEYSALINEYAKVQHDVLDERNIHRLSKPFWHQWLDKSDEHQSEEKENISDVEPAVSHKIPADDSNIVSTIGVSKDEPLTEKANLDLSNNLGEPRDSLDPDAVGEEPAFSRLNQAVCEVLQALLDQIEPPPMAKENYQTAKKQIEKGLNWYELVPTLEDISWVVVSAFDRNQQEFETFLTQLNERLLQAYQLTSESKQASDVSREAGLRLSDSMREQVSAMQQSVEEATELDQLKSQVTNRLDAIVSAMDHYQNGEQQREATLSEQLDALVVQVKQMEAASGEAEQRIEEQRQKALRDVLTQLPNREAYNGRLEQEAERWQRYGRPLSMVVCDVDHFKHINDNYGHLAGDKVLRIIAKTLQKRLRKTDFIARIGGEEFVVLMPETEQDAAFKVVEGVREAIANCPFHFKEQPVTLTMSFGVSTFIEGDNGEQVFSRCDKALYQAKDQGRNQSILAEVPRFKLTSSE